MDITVFLENLDDLSSLDFERFAAQAASAAECSDRSAFLALCAVGTGDTQGALSWIEDVKRFDSPTDFAAFASASVYLRTGNLASAIEPLQQIGEQFSKYRDAQVLLATAYLYSGHVDEAERIAQDVDHQDDDMRASLLGLRARCAQARSDEDSARALFREALMYAPQLEWVREALKSQAKVVPESPNSQLQVVVI